MITLLEALQKDFVEEQDSDLEENNITSNLDGGLGQPRTPFAFQSKPKSAKDKLKQKKLQGSTPYTKADKTNLWFKKIESAIKEAEDPCWKGYKQLGMKIKNGKKVPNCVKESKKSIQFESEYKDFFKQALDKENKSISSMSDAEKKRFFNKVDSEWKSKNESYRSIKKCCKG